MADPKTNLQVSISGDLAGIKSALVSLQAQLKLAADKAAKLVR